jgi:uncharacterized zinc-type alcohol dehydrogenase-like protein
MPENFELTVNNLGLSIYRVNFNVSLTGDRKETQNVINDCADTKFTHRSRSLKPNRSMKPGRM